MGKFAGKVSRKYIAAAFVIVVLVGASLGRVLRQKQPDIIFILLDTLRADHMSLYGYERDTTPFLTRFGREAVTFDNAISVGNWTPNVVASAFTGLYPSSHGVNPRTRTFKGGKLMESYLSPDLPVLPALLEERGYATAAVSANRWITPKFGFGRGFGSFKYIGYADGRTVTQEGLNSLDELKRTGKPFFLYLHYMDAHEPRRETSEMVVYDGSAGARSYASREQKLLAIYDSNIRFLDTMLERFFDGLKERGLFESTKIVIVADHGEQFRERGFQGHGHLLFNEEVRVPLILKGGRPGGTRVQDTVSNLDLFQTLLSWAKVESPLGTGGVSLFDDEAIRRRGGVLSETNRAGNRTPTQKAFVDNQGKKIILERLRGGTGKPYTRVRGVFDTRSDPYELRPLRDKKLTKELTSNLIKGFQNAKGVKAKSDGIEVDRQTIEQLKTLGYIN